MENNVNNFNAFLETVSSMMENKDFVELLKQKKEQKQKELLTFTEKEIDKMPKTFRKEFRTDGCTARVYKRQTGKECFVYDIMYRRNGYKVIVTHKSLEEAKRIFIERLKTAQKVEKKPKTVPNTFNAFALYHFENFRKKKVKEKTYENDLSRYKKYLQPYFEEKPLTKITSLECQDLIEEIDNAGKGKTAEEI